MGGLGPGQAKPRLQPQEIGLSCSPRSNQVSLKLNYHHLFIQPNNPQIIGKYHSHTNQHSGECSFHIYFLSIMFCVTGIITERFREESIFLNRNQHFNFVWLKFSVEFELSYTPSTILPACHLVELIVKLNNCLLKHFGMHRQRTNKVTVCFIQTLIRLFDCKFSILRYLKLCAQFAIQIIQCRRRF